MSESAKILLTSGLTVVVGVFVFVIGRIIERFFIDTVYDLKMTVKEIRYSLRYYGGEINNPGIGRQERMTEASDKLRELGTQLPAKIQAVPFYGVLRFFRFVQKRDILYDVSGKLITISNTVRGHSDERVQGEFVRLNIQSMEELAKLIGGLGRP